MKKDLECGKILGTEINWIEGKNLCSEKKVKKQKNKKTGKTREKTKVIEKESFFQLFMTRNAVDDEVSEISLEGVQVEYVVEEIADAFQILCNFYLKYAIPSFFGVEIPSYAMLGLDNFAFDEEEEEEENSEDYLSIE